MTILTGALLYTVCVHEWVRILTGIGISITSNPPPCEVRDPKWQEECRLQAYRLYTQGHPGIPFDDRHWGYPPSTEQRNWEKYHETYKEKCKQEQYPPYALVFDHRSTFNSLKAEPSYEQCILEMELYDRIHKTDYGIPLTPRDLCHHLRPDWDAYYHETYQPFKELQVVFDDDEDEDFSTCDLEDEPMPCVPGPVTWYGYPCSETRITGVTGWT